MVNRANDSTRERTTEEANCQQHGTNDTADDCANQIRADSLTQDKWHTTANRQRIAQKTTITTEQDSQRQERHNTWTSNYDEQTHGSLHHAYSVDNNEKAYDYYFDFSFRAYFPILTISSDKRSSTEA